MGLSKNNSFLTKEAKSYIARTEKKKRVPLYELLESSAFLSSVVIEIVERQVYDSYII